jgi:hypothetical protein
MTGRDGKVVVASRPVNRRTAAKPAAPMAIAASVKARLKAQRARHQLGAPLAAQLSIGSTAQQAVRKSVLAGTVVGTAASVGLFLSWLQASVAMAAISATALAAGLVLIYMGRGHGRQSVTPESATSPLLNMDCVAAFDRALEALDGTLSAELQQALIGLKSLFLRLAKHPAAAAQDEHFTSEDRFYVNECLRRYLPDSLQAYLAVPANEREKGDAPHSTPLAIVMGQIALLTSELNAREAKLALSAKEALLRQERFLQSKHRA